MDSRKLDQRIILQQASYTRGADGSSIATYSTLATVWANKAHKSSREFWAAQKINSEVTDLFVIRYRKLMNTTMRIVHDGKTYNIIGTDDPDGRRREFHLLAQEVI